MFKTIHRISDITLADAWGVQHYCPEMHDNKGTSLVFVHSGKGRDIIIKNASNLLMVLQNVSEVTEYNMSLIQSVEKPIRRSDFFRKFSLLNNFPYAATSIDKDNFKRRIIRKIKKLLHC